MTSWETYRLGEIGKIVTGKTPRTSQSEYFDGDIPFITPADLNTPFKRILSTQRTLTIEGLNSIKGCIIPANSIAVSCIGNLGYVGITNQICATNQQINTIIVNNQFDSHFIYYTIKHLWPYFKNLEGQSTTLSILNKTQFSQIEISLPSLEEQRRIAGILGAIDDKIENNRCINTNLELQAQALYKQWFVDNRSDDWEEKQLSEIALHITDGVHNTVIDSPEGEYYLLSCKNIKSGQLLIGSNERRIDRETFAKLRKRTRLSQGDILVTSVGTVGEMYLVNEFPTNYEFQRSVAIIKPNQDIISSYFLYAALLYQRNELKHLAHGAVQQCIFISDLKEYSFIVPNKNDISAFDEVVAPMFNKIGELQKENEALSTLRDTLLPKLMNGEIKL